MKMFKSLLSLVLVFSVLFLTDCSTEEAIVPEVPLESIVYKDLNADYAPLVFKPGDPRPTRPAQKNKYTFFSFKTGAIVPNADSATNKWDIGFRSTSIILNGGTSGPGTAGVIVQQGIFTDIKTAPSTGYVQDNYNYVTKTGTFAISSSALATGATASNQWWFNAGSAQSTIISPIAGQVFIIKTSEGRYAKMEVLNFYKGAPATINNLTDPDRYYTFRYVYQQQATTNF
jgi:hypothetical protein